MAALPSCLVQGIQVQVTFVLPSVIVCLLKSHENQRLPLGLESGFCGARLSALLEPRSSCETKNYSVLINFA